MKKQLLLTGILLVGGISLASASHHQSEKSPKVLVTTDVTAPTAPTIALIGTSSSTIRISLGGSIDNVGVANYVVYKNGVSVGPTNSSTYTVKNLTPNTTYSITVKAKDAAGNISAASNIITVTTPGEFGNYCSVSSANTNNIRLGSMEFGSIKNNTDFTESFKDFTSMSTTIKRGLSYPMTLYFRYSDSYTKNDFYSTVYVDFNQNNIFESGEQVVNSQVAYDPYDYLVQYITVPTDALLGPTRMRVIVNEASNTMACGTNTGGQATDYTVNIVANSAAKSTVGKEALDTNIAKSKNLIFNDIKIYPNPVKDILTISNMDSEEYKIFNMEGKQISSGKLVRGSANVSGLVKGVYTIQIGDISKRFIKN